MRPAICRLNASTSQAMQATRTSRITCDGTLPMIAAAVGAMPPTATEAIDTPLSQVAVSFLRSLRAALFIDASRARWSFVEPGRSSGQLPVGRDGFVADLAPEAVVQHGEVGGGGVAGALAAGDRDLDDVLDPPGTAREHDDTVGEPDRLVEVVGDVDRR